MISCFLSAVPLVFVVGYGAVLVADISACGLRRRSIDFFPNSTICDGIYGNQLIYLLSIVLVSGLIPMPSDFCKLSADLLRWSAT